MGKTISSPDISVLDFSVLMDLSLTTPKVTVTNLSTVINTANLQWAFELHSPTGQPIYVGNFNTPDIDGTAFTSFDIPATIPQFFKQVQFSNTGAYTVKVLVKDGNDNFFDLSTGQPLCLPNGNNGKNNFGAAMIDVTPNCGKGRLIVTDKTNLLYKGLSGTKVSVDVELSYPKGDDGTEYTAEPIHALPCAIPIKVEGEGYEVYVAEIYDYNLGGNFNVRIRYYFKKEFAIWCSLSLQPLLCEVQKIANELEKNCNDNADTRIKYKKLTLANTKMVMAHSGLLEPLSGFDVPKLIQEVKELLDIQCDCCRPAGISGLGLALTTDALFTTANDCGDSEFTFENDGNGNIVLHYATKTYTFLMHPANETAAFEWVPNNTGCNVENALKVDLEVLSEEILSTIGAPGNTNLYNMLNDLINRTALACSGLDGKTVINLEGCNYSVQVKSKVVGTAIVKTVINGNDYLAPFGTLLTDASAVQTWLNSLSLGTWAASFASNTLSISTNANTNAISTIVVDDGTDEIAYQFINNCGLVCTILQGIINFLDSINLLKIKNGFDVTVCRFGKDGTVLQQDFLADGLASDLIKYMANSLCNVVNYMKDKNLTCANMKALFAAYTGSTGLLSGSDWIMTVKDGKCQIMPFKEFSISLINLIRNDSDVKTAYCQITPCSTVAGCSPVTGLAGSIADTTAAFTWDPIAGATGYKWSMDGVTWNLVLSTAATVTGLTAATGYTFRVYPVYSTGDGVACTVTNSFTTTNAGVACAAPASLVLDLATETSFRATWKAVAGASGYQYRVNGGGWINVGAVLSYSPGGLTAATLYTFEVRAIIGGNPCTDISSDTITTNEITVLGTISVANCSHGNKIAEIRFNSEIIPVGSDYPVSEGADDTGAVANFALNGILEIDISDHDGAGTNTRIEVTDSNANTSCQPITGNATYTFTLFDIVEGQDFTIAIVCGGTCP